ncbi:MAG: haloacid dehalogenase-like hydrolase [Atopobiaceae bacterium]|nr:haloacid dehalogenase-like hydrolase [Atopobiaceae bacterium]
MNAYDFDGTIFPTNCTVGFAFWSMWRHPKLYFTYLPKILLSFAGYKLGRVPSFRMQRQLFEYLTKIDDFDEQIEKYWDANESKICSWYLEQKRPDDLIISAAPSCLIGPIAKRLGVNYVATDYDRELGVLLNNLMYAKEKARYIIDHGFPVIENFYSDSLTDTPLALCSEKAYLVKNRGTTVVDWPHLDPETVVKVKKKLDTGWNIHIKDD